jgi:hypothetical protein
MFELLDGVETHIWLSYNQPDPELFAAKSVVTQINNLEHYVFRYSKLHEAKISVVSSHRCTSVVFPVYRIKLGENYFICRGNNFNWQVSVQADRKLFINSTGLFDRNVSPIAQVCEGFKDEWVLGPYVDDRYNYSCTFEGILSLHNLLFLYHQSIEIRKSHN